MDWNGVGAGSGRRETGNFGCGGRPPMRDCSARCPVCAYERAGEGYAGMVAEWLADPHAYFKAFGREAREFQKRHRSERLRTMTLVAPAEELAEMRPTCLCLDRASETVDSWETAFARACGKLLEARPQTFAALQDAGELDWLGCPAGGTPVAETYAADALQPTFESFPGVVRRIQWLFLMCGVRLNEVIVQVDPYTDEAWAVRHAEMQRKRAADKAFMEGRRAAQKAWAEAHPGETQRGTPESRGTSFWG